MQDYGCHFIMLLNTLTASVWSSLAQFGRVFDLGSKVPKIVTVLYSRKQHTLSSA